MNKKKFIEDTLKFLEKNLSYDGEGDTLCPHCKKVIHKGNVWLYHYTSMAGNLAFQLGLTGVLERACIDFFVNQEYSFVDGDSKEDANRLATELYQFLFE